MLIFILCAGLMLQAEGAAPVHNSPVLGEVIFNVRDTLFNTLLGLFSQRKYGPDVDTLANTFSFIRVIKDPKNVNNMRWSPFDSLAFGMANTFLYRSPGTCGTSVLNAVSLPQCQDWKRVVCRFERYRVNITRYIQCRPRMSAVLRNTALLVVSILMFGFGKILYRLGSGIIILGLFPHTILFFTRVIFTERPSFATLHEPFLLMAWSGIIIGLFWELLQKDGIRLLIVTGIGFVFTYAVVNFGDRESLEMISACLKNVFWFTRYVLSGILGVVCVGALLLRGCILLDRIMWSSPSKHLRLINNSISEVLTFGRVFTIIGIVIGGIWTGHTWVN